MKGTSRPVLFLFCVFFSSAAAWLVFSVITRRIALIGAALRKFAAGDFGYRLAASGNDELSRYVWSFNSTADRTVTAMNTLSGVKDQRREMFANISHDLRRPLASIINTLETLADESVPLEEAEEGKMLRLAAKRAQDLESLIGSISQLSELDRPIVSFERRPIRLGDELREVLATCRYLAEQKCISLSLANCDEGIVLPCEVILLRRAIANLVENAILYSDPGGRVTIGCSATAETVTVTIADTGCGIPADELHGIFKPFGRGSQSRAENKSGTGLGLSIAKQIVELHGGTLKVKSRVGMGSEFTAEFLIQ